MKRIRLSIAVAALAVAALFVAKRTVDSDPSLPGKESGRPAATTLHDPSGTTAKTLTGSVTGSGRKYATSDRPLRRAPTPDPADALLEYDEYGEPIVVATPIAPPRSLRALLDRTTSLAELTESEFATLAQEFAKWGAAADGAAIRFALEQLSGERRLDLALDAFHSWAEIDIAAAADHVATLTSNGSDTLAFAVPSRYIAHDRDAAVDWAFQKAPTIYRNHIAQRTIIEWNRGNDGSASASWVKNEIAGRDRLQIYEQNAVREVVETLARQDFERARDYIGELDSLEGQQAGVAVLIDHWAEEDIAAASTWLDQISTKAGTAANDGTYDEAYRVMAFRTVEHDVAAAQRWVDRISDDSEHESLVNQLTAKLVQSQ